MRVLHVIPSVSANSGGPAQAIFPMCRSLKSQGIDVLLATSDAGISDAPLPETVVSYNDVPTIFFHSQLGRSFKFSKPMSSWLKASIQDFDLVHIHAVFNHACVAASRACVATGIPYVIRPLRRPGLQAARHDRGGERQPADSGGACAASRSLAHFSPALSQ